VVTLTARGRQESQETKWVSKEAQSVAREKKIYSIWDLTK